MSLPSRRSALVGASSIAALGAVGAATWYWWPQASPGTSDPPPPGWDVYAGAFFGHEPFIPDFSPPKVRLLPLPDSDGTSPVWGAVGRDAAGAIWVAAASSSAEKPSGRLLEYDPATETIHPRGDVLSELRRLGLDRTGERQSSLPTKFFLGEDGGLYFASTDAPPPEEPPALKPKWGSHLWRIRKGMWEHLRGCSEGVHALAGNGRLMYFLASPDHVLMQYDCATGAFRQVVVGSVEGHVSRNLLCDFRGHAYIPRPKRVAANRTEATLVEFGPDLREVTEHPLPHYHDGGGAEGHGILAYQPLADGSIAFTTHLGRLFRLDPARGRSRLSDLGWFHPAGRSYASGLFAFSGERYLVGTARIDKSWVWVCHDLETAKSRELPFDWPLPAHGASPDLSVAGCTTRDNSGDFYLTGALRSDKGRSKPVVFRVRVSE